MGRPRGWAGRRSFAVLAALAAFALIAAACGDDDDTGPSTTAATTAATTATTTATTTGTTTGGTVATTAATTTTTAAPTDIDIARAEAEALGLNFMSSHEEIEACAAEEGSVVVQTSTDEFEPFEEAFEAQYPYIDMEWAELSGSATERFLLEVESGAAGRYDVGYPAPEAYNEIADRMNWDLLGMSQAGILDIPVGNIDQIRRTVLAAGHSGVALAYNKDLISADELPTTWDELADPKWGELGMSMDVDLNNVSVLATHPDWPIERVAQLMADMAATGGVTYTDGHTAAALLVQSGEVAISPFINLHSLMRRVDREPDGPLQVHFVEPVPVRASEAYGVYDDSLGEAPCASLLFIEWIANSDAAQELLDADPLQASLYWANSRMAEMIGSRSATIADPAGVAQLPEWIAQIQEAAGFPTIAEG